MVPRSVSFVDLKNSVPGAVGVMERNNHKEVANLLDQLGFDTKLGWEIVWCNHRPLTENEPVYGPRVQGYEKSSDEWKRSNLASDECLTDEIDPTLYSDMVNMSKRANNTAWICDVVKNANSGNKE